MDIMIQSERAFGCEALFKGGVRLIQVSKQEAEGREYDDVAHLF